MPLTPPAQPPVTFQPDALVSEIRMLCDLARGIADARSLRLVLPQAPWAGHAAVLQAAGLAARTAPPAMAAEIGTEPARLPGAGPQPSDMLSLRVPVLRGGRMALLELHEARPDALAQRQRRTLGLVGQMLARRLDELSDRDSQLATRLLHLIEAVADHDASAGSHVLTGLLRLASGAAPRSVEVTALRIAGLADLAGNRVVLTDEGQQTLARAQMTPALPDGGAAMDSGDPRPLPATPRAASVPAPDWIAFARIAIAGQSFDIAEAGDDAPLAFRPAGASAGWAGLRNGLADGWAEIAAEIRGRTTDVMREYIRMHMIRRRDIELAEVAELYDLHGMEWWVRPAETGHEICVQGQGWLALVQEPDAATAPAGLVLSRERAIGALMQLWPDLADRIGPDVRAWSRRMAAGVQVTPLAA